VASLKRVEKLLIKKTTRSKRNTHQWPSHYRRAVGDGATFGIGNPGHLCLASLRPYPRAFARGKFLTYRRAVRDLAETCHQLKHFVRCARAARETSGALPAAAVASEAPFSRAYSSRRIWLPSRGLGGKHHRPERPNCPSQARCPAVLPHI
jgi:hypothetical protein